MAIRQKLNGTIGINPWMMAVLIVIFFLSVTELSATQQNFQKGLVRYENGEYRKAFQFFLAAAQKGNAESQYNLATMYATGKGTSQDYTKALDWFIKAAEQGNEDAIKVLEGF